MNETPRAVFIALLDESETDARECAPSDDALAAWRRQWLDRYDEAEGEL